MAHFQTLHTFCQYHEYGYVVRWPKWLTFHFHTTSQFRILNSEFRNPNSEISRTNWTLDYTDLFQFCKRLSEMSVVKHPKDCDSKREWQSHSKN